MNQGVELQFFLGISALLLSVGQAFAVSGTVKDGQGAAISGAKVALASDTSKFAMTNASGAFTLDPPLSLFERGSAGRTGQGISGVTLQGNQIRFMLARPANEGAIALFSSDGQRHGEWPLVAITAGEDGIDLPRLTPGLYFLRLRVDGMVAEARLLQTGHGAKLYAQGTQGFGQPASQGDEAGRDQGMAVLARAAARSAAIDTLITSKSGYTTQKTPIDAYAQTNVAIVLSAASSLPPVTDYSAMGPYQVVTENSTGPDGSYTIIRPRTLGENGFLHAPITFGPGTGMQVSQLSNLIQRIASHGFVVIGRQLTGGPGDAVTRQRLIAGLEWIIAQNSVAGSAYQGKIAVNKGVAMGYSVGATGSIEIGGHAALATVVAIHGHSAEGDARVPMLMIGGTQDLNGSQSWLAPSYAASKTQTFFSLLTGANHGYIQTTVNGVQGGLETPAIIAWIRYWIYNDQGAKNYFYGDDCIMCKSPWANTQRKNWQ